MVEEVDRVTDAWKARTPSRQTERPDSKANVFNRPVSRPRGMSAEYSQQEVTCARLHRSSRTPRVICGVQGPVRNAESSCTSPLSPLFNAGLPTTRRLCCKRECSFLPHPFTCSEDRACHHFACASKLLQIFISEK